MSFASKTVLYTSVVASIGTVIYVHYRQEYDREQLHLGVVRDLERQERKRENLRILEEQRKFQDSLEKAQLSTNPSITGQTSPNVS